MKKFLVIFEVVLFMVAISVIDTTLVPAILAGALFYPVHKILCKMTENELRATFGLTWLEKKFGNSNAIKIFTDINE